MNSKYLEQPLRSEEEARREVQSGEIMFRTSRLDSGPHTPIKISLFSHGPDSAWHGGLRFDDAEADAFERMVKSHAGVVEALEVTTIALNAARLIMTDKETRDLAGEIEAQGRTALAAAKGES